MIFEDDDSRPEGGARLGAALVNAMDEAAALSEILALLFWASEGIGGPHGAALARGAMVAQERLEALQAALRLNKD